MVSLELKSFKSLLTQLVDANLTYHRERTKCYDALVACRKAAAYEEAVSFVIPLSDFLSMKQFLTSRSSKIQENDSMSLQFQKLLESLAERLNEEEADVPDDVVAARAPHVERKDEAEAPKAADHGSK